MIEQSLTVGREERARGASVTFRFMAPDEQVLRLARRTCNALQYKGARVERVVLCHNGAAGPEQGPYSVTLEGSLGENNFLLRRAGNNLLALLDEVASLVHLKLRSS